MKVTYDKWFYYMWTQHHLERFIFLAADKATTMGHIKREELDKAEVIIPDDEIYEKLTMTFSPIIDIIVRNRTENTYNNKEKFITRIKCKI